MGTFSEHILDQPIGAVRRERRGDDVAGGSLRGLSFRLRWSASTSTEGELTLALGGDQVWTTAPQTLSEPAWSDFLSGLARAWLYVRLEETYPRGVTPETPSRTERSLLDRVISADAAVHEFRVFRQHHDISAWFSQNLGFPQMWIVREGNFMLLEGGNRILRWAFSDVIRTLQHLGNSIAGRLSSAVDTAAKVALRLWDQREEAADSDLENITLGITSDRLSRLRQVLPLRARAQIFSGVDEVRAAARMLASFADDGVVLQVADLIRSQPRREIPELLKLSRQALEALSDVDRKLPRLQGRHVARWLRGALGYAEQMDRVNPEGLLKAWNVAIVPFTTVRHIEAISFWGPSHGPAILLNTGGRRSRPSKAAWHGASGGARFTLAHELCHLLLDREGSLPVAEVLGGSVPNAPEERANAFAAEFLLPEGAAGSVYTNSPSVDAALRSLTGTFGVTKTLAAWQILKRFGEGSPALGESDFWILHQITRPRRNPTV